MPKTITNATVIGQRVLNATTKLIEVYAPEIAKTAVPGQFVNVQVCQNMSSLANNAVDHNESTIIRIYSGNAKRTARLLIFWQKCAVEIS